MPQPRYLSGSNGFVPQASGQVIAYTRKPDRFRINQYVQMVKSPKTIGLYLQLDRDQPVRVTSDAIFAFEDGAERPKGHNNVGNFQWIEFRCKRRDYPFTLGWQAIDQADWKPLAFHAAMVSNQAMTNRTIRVITLLETTANWGANLAPANTLNAGTGFWQNASDDPADPNYLAIKKSVMEAVRRIFLGTNSLVSFPDLCLVISPGLAIAMSETPEIHDYLARSQFALSQIKGEVAGQNAAWGLPEQLYGLKVVVEDAVKVTTQPTSDGAMTATGRGFVKSDNSALIVSRPGGLDGEFGAPSFSTVQLYYYKDEFRVLSFDDAKNERTEGHVEDNLAEVIAAAPAGFLIQNTMS